MPRKTEPSKKTGGKQGRNRHGMGAFSDWVRKDRDGKVKKIGRKAAIELPRTPDGKRKRHWFYGQNDKDVQRQIDEFRRLQERGIEVRKRSGETVRDYLIRWLRDVASLSVKPITLDSYERKIRVHIIPGLGTIKVADLKPAHLVAFYTERYRAKCSKRTVQYCHAIIRKALNDAVETLKELPYSPAERVKVQRPTREDPKVIPPEDLHRMCSEIIHDWLYPFFYLAIVSGCRRGELCALKWDDINWERRTLRVDESTQELPEDDGDGNPHIQRRRRPNKKERLVALPGSGLIYEKPKSEKSRRTIKLPEGAMEVLRFQQQLQAVVREKAGSTWQENNFVFTNARGAGLRPSVVSNHWKLIRGRAGIPGVKLHGLRHTSATIMLEAGVHPRVAAERLGHASSQLFMELYGRVLNTLQDEAANAIGQLMPDALQLPSKKP